MNDTVTQPAPHPQPSTIQKVLTGMERLSSFLGSGLKILFYGLGLLFVLGLITTTFGGGETREYKTLYGSGAEKVAVIYLTGTIMDSPTTNPLSFAEQTATSPGDMFDMLEKVKRDETIKAVVLRINSPGGSVTASEEIYQIITDFKEATQIPVIASFSEVAASGGFYIAMAADHIVSNQTTLTGSIGVIASTVNYKDLADRFGVKDVTITSGDNKSFLNPLQDVDEEEIEILRSIINESYELFLTRVLDNREIDREELLTVADGRPISGQQAFELGLVDSLGNLTDSTEIAREVSGFRDAAVVEINTGTLLDSLLEGIGSIAVPTTYNPLEHLIKLDNKPSYYYAPDLF